MTTSLKLATNTDIPVILELANAFASENPDNPGGSDYDPVSTEETVRAILRDPTKGIVVLYLSDGKPVGFIGGIITKMLTSTNLVATEMFWYVSPAFRGNRRSLSLKEAFEFWGKKMGAKFIAMSAIPNETVERYYERTGYRLKEKSYLKVIG